MKREFLAVLILIMVISCHKQDTQNSYYFLQGNYLGNRYHWHRDYDINHNVIESFDTLYNITSALEIDEDNNTIIFGGILYANHPDLKLFSTYDTISALKDFGVKPINQFRLIKSSKNVTITNSYYAPNGVPADKVIEDYFKN